MMRNRTILIRPLLVALVLFALGAVAACERGTRAARAQSSGGEARREGAAPAGEGIDWTRVTDRDLNIASLFLLARDQGVRPALDSLKTLTAQDEDLRTRGHEMAHALGRFAMGQRRDLALLGECTPLFQSGCYHGALEGFFLHGGTVDRASIRGICTPPAGREAPGYEQLECWHGLGHGLMVRFAGDIRQALPLCDALETPRALRECRDGVFMERAIRAVGVPSINVGDAPAIRGGHAGHGAGGGHDAHGGHGSSSPASAAPARELSRDELLRLCEGIDAPYQPSCWAYQPVALLRVHGMNAETILRACDAAPAEAVRDCYQGFGKQFLGAMGGEALPMIAACRQGNREYATDCLMGGVEYFTDLEWTLEPGVAFCRQVPADAKARCYRMIGERAALVHPRAEGRASACRAAETPYVPACRTGSGLSTS